MFKKKEEMTPVSSVQVALGGIRRERDKTEREERAGVARCIWAQHMLWLPSLPVEIKTRNGRPSRFKRIIATTDDLRHRKSTGAYTWSKNVELLCRELRSIGMVIHIQAP
jgi:hypothetical protein